MVYANTKRRHFLDIIDRYDLEYFYAKTGVILKKSTSEMNNDIDKKRKIIRYLEIKKGHKTKDWILYLTYVQSKKREVLAYLDHNDLEYLYKKSKNILSKLNNKKK